MVGIFSSVFKFSRFPISYLDTKVGFLSRLTSFLTTGAAIIYFLTVVVAGDALKLA